MFEKPSYKYKHSYLGASVASVHETKNTTVLYNKLPNYKMNLIFHLPLIIFQTRHKTNLSQHLPNNGLRARATLLINSFKYASD